MRQRLELVCAFCGTAHEHETYTELPREKIDCKCGATAELTVLSTDRIKTVRKCEWSFEA